MWLLSSRLQDAGYSVERIGYTSLNKDPDQIIDNITNQINSSINNHSAKIHFVGHSLGGLLIRAYLDSVKVTNLGHVVLIGTPNNGTAFVDKYRDRWWLKMFGGTTLSLGTSDGDFPKKIADPYYPVGIIAGKSESIDNDKIIPGDDDGIVTVESTKLAGMTDFIVIETSHMMLRYNEDVAIQTIEFLINGKFRKNNEGKKY